MPDRQDVTVYGKDGDGNPIEVAATIISDARTVRPGETARSLEERGITPPEHNCDEHPVLYRDETSHGVECGVCGAFLQTG